MSGELRQYQFIGKEVLREIMPGYTPNRIIRVTSCSSVAAIIPAGGESVSLRLHPRLGLIPQEADPHRIDAIPARLTGRECFGYDPRILVHFYKIRNGGIFWSQVIVHLGDRLKMLHTCSRIPIVFIFYKSRGL